MKIRYLNIKNVVILCIVYCLSSVTAFATKLPDYILETLKSQLPEASVRFDGLVTLPGNVIYLPVLPSNPKKNPSGKVVSTYPADKKLSQLPEVILFDSNFALLKVIKDKNGHITVTDSKNIPFVIKTGLFPQDMLVPPGLIIPDDMKIMMGDLKIALANSSVNDIFKDHTLSSSAKETKFIPVPYMNGKTLLITTLDSKLINVIPSDSNVPKFTLTLENLPKFVQPVCDDNYILVAAAGKTYIDVADVKQEVLAKKIDLGFEPSEIILNSDKTKAYVAASNEHALFVIDLKTMSLSEKIKVKGYPKNISISNDDKIIAYLDKNTGDIYTLNLDGTYLNSYAYNASNVSKLVVMGKNIYLLSRTKNELQVVDTEIKDIIFKQPLAKKPVDMMLVNDRLYILCASGEIDVFKLEDYSCEILLKLPEKGFYKKLVRIDNSNLFLITNVSDKKYYIYDFEKNAVLQSVDTTVFINDLQLLNKRLK